MSDPTPTDELPQDEAPALEAEVSSTDSPDTPAGASEQAAAPSASTPTSEAPAESTATPAAPAFSLREYLKGTAGLDLSGKYQTDEDAARGIREALSLIGKKSEKERQAEQIIAYFQQQQLAAQQAQQPAAPQNGQADPNRPFWNPPEVKPTDKRWVEPDPDNPGTSRIKANAPLDVRQRLEAFVNYSDEYQYKLQHAPHELYQEITSRAAAEAEERAFQRMMAYQQQQQAVFAEQQQIGQITAVRRAMLVQTATDGSPMLDAAGAPVLTPYGRAYVEVEQQLYTRGISDHALRDSLAHEIASAKAASGLSKPAPKQTPGATKAATATGGKVDASGRKTHGKGLSLTERIFADNPHLKPDDEIIGVELVS